MDSKVQPTVRMRRILNIFGILIFGGLAISYVIPLPISSKYTNEFILFMLVSTILYYILVNIYFMGQMGEKIFTRVLFIVGLFSIFMAFYI
ncbi:hypothetical protein [Sutcliffiella rhizosphaerae]|uniref:Uncharacterized protein n=1 Tax=Sutcliffiella rhizosphaerae TaxID=2880967 RepID=A0ABM8YKJ9_9BACI|nr:hypothetical protein [Sutcliffiella rhizosphaerae]CAG9620389.1 hypothetical protein BACCIP111883_01157 [Sutcliffiella rhizosphaerae]